MNDKLSGSLHRQIAVVGGSYCDGGLAARAREVGRHLAEAGAVILCGGRGGVMEAVSDGAKRAGGVVVGVLPGFDPAASPPNRHLSAALFTGMGQARNQILVLSAGAVIAIGGGWGTLSEIALALKHGVPVVTLDSWELSRPDRRPEPLLYRRSAPEAAVHLALALADERVDPAKGDMP